ncbi:hypothetical protein [Stutzerimonas stutzeri]|uniref:Uncharacterized protein n=1 Tax=Stutzerimonas stutzeri KOS6 TaxID=1218352 RepID=A0A061JKY1_STUST|nr:hypothetical protein [Stutzerimonas stutzeri]EWC38965.1 hypothetical protein B597_022685 [Stutzerimonas stutzeri KOS6]
MSDQDIERRIARDIANWQRGVQEKGEPLVLDNGWLQTPPGLRSNSIAPGAGLPQRQRACTGSSWEARPRGDAGRKAVEALNTA